MPHANIWIRKENLLRWEAIDDKSAWVNAMLGEAAPTKKVLDEGNEAPYPAVDIFKKDTIGKDDTKPNGHKEAVLNDIRTTNDFKRLENGVCKIHGTPLDSRGKCLQKGCKYG